jgi:DNA-binding transcriptional ArsR family regulator
MNDFAAFVERDARLIILRALAGETSRTHNEVLLQAALEAHGVARSRNYVRTQLRVLEELGAVTLREAGTVMIASLTRAGLDHVEGRGIVEGVNRPSPGV